MKPNFLVIGAQKCATSSLCYLLGQHPDVFMTEPKEPYFFSDPEIWARGWEWYESLFADAGNAKMRGEGSTTYTMRDLYPEAADRIAAHLPHAKLIYIVRDPLERIQSHWMHLRSRANREIRPFNEAVRERPEYIDNSRYWKQISVYRERFPDEQILVLFFDDFRRDAKEAIRRCFAFLGVDDAFEPSSAEEPRHVSREGRVDGAVLPLLRKVPVFTRLRNVSPEWMRGLLARILKRPIEERPQWNNETLRWAVQELAEDSRQFLNHYGKSDSLWRWISESGISTDAPDQRL